MRSSSRLSAEDRGFEVSAFTSLGDAMTGLLDAEVGIERLPEEARTRTATWHSCDIGPRIVRLS